MINSGPAHHVREVMRQMEVVSYSTLEGRERNPRIIRSNKIPTSRGEGKGPSSLSLLHCCFLAPVSHPFATTTSRVFVCLVIALIRSVFRHSGSFLSLRGVFPYVKGLSLACEGFLFLERSFCKDFF